MINFPGFNKVHFPATEKCMFESPANSFLSVSCDLLNYVRLHREIFANVLMDDVLGKSFERYLCLKMENGTRVGVCTVML